MVAPSKKLKVRITSDMVRDMPHPAHPFLARVTGDRDAKEDAEKYADAEMVVKKVKVVNRDAADESEGAEDTVAFKADKFGPYAIMQLVDAEVGEADEGASLDETPTPTNVLTASGETYSITVTFDDAAEIPAGTKLVATEIESGSEEFLEHLGRLWSEVNKEYFEVEEKREHYDESMGELPDVHLTNINTARFFDITFVHDGKEIEPKTPVAVEVSHEQGLHAPD